MCMLFHRRASTCLEEAMKRARQERSEIIEAVRAYKLRERQSRITDDLVDRIAAHPEDYDVAANRDPNARLEAETPDE